MACSSTIFVIGVFTMDEWIRSYMGLKWRCQSSIATTEPAPVRSAVADQPQAMAAVWRQHAGVGPAGQASTRA